jgi:hypothetical protein
MRTLCRFALLALALAAVPVAAATPASAGPKPLPPLTPASRDALTRALEAGRLSEAEYALERAHSIFQLGRVRAEFGDVKRAGPRDATFLLRDLALRLRFLSGRERDEAERILARPDSGGVPVGNGWSGSATRASRCSNDPIELCFHWVTNTTDIASPSFVDAVQATLEDVWGEEIDAIGYRAPLDDRSSRNDGGGPELDIYLDDLGASNVFGYCTSDDPARTNPLVFAVSAYCVLDNDYSPLQFGQSQTPTEFLQVTAAHEFNHASQFAYDWLEDLWLMEGTATNIEETVYPSVNDNIGFLRRSQLRHPDVPLDRGGLGDTEYGAWIFWRFLEEKVYDGDPTAILRVWERADASTPFARDNYSLRAARRQLRADGRSFIDEYASFGVTNRLRTYADGRLYPRTPTDDNFWVGSVRPSTGWQAWPMNHLTTRYFTFKPGRSVSADARLRVSVDLSFYGTRATLVSYADSGRTVRRITLGEGARGSRTVPFGRGTLKRVDLVLSNGSTRTRCWQDLRDPPFYSCFGRPLDDRRTERFRAVLR